MDKEKKAEEITSPEVEAEKLEVNQSEELQEEETINQEKLKIFIKNDLIGGYSLAVRDNWGFKVLRRHITDREKELFVQKFGEKLIKDDEFFHWWCGVNEIDNKDYNLEGASNSDLYDF